MEIGNQIKQLRLHRGITQEAIDTLKKELEVQKTEWDVTTGETAEVVRRNIARLEQQINT